MLTRVLAITTLSIVLLATAPAMAAPELKEAKWETVTDRSNAIKKYPFLSSVFEQVDDEAGRTITDASLGIFNLTPTQNFVALKIEDSDYCGAAFGCTTFFFLQDSPKSGRRIFDLPIPGEVYAGTCGKNVAMAVQLWDPFTHEERYRVFPQGPDGDLHFGQFFPTLDKVDLCSPIDTEVDSQ